jgi:phage gpG-like protein
LLSINLVGDRELIARFQAMPSKVHAALLKKVTALRLKLEAHIKDQKLSGQVLHVQTGNLRASIFSETIDSAESVIGRAASSGDVKYAGIHEFGGQTPAHVIEAKGNALAFMFQGKQAFFKRVNHPGSTMPERSFMRSSLADMRDEIVQGMTDAVKGAAAEK